MSDTPPISAASLILHLNQERLREVLINFLKHRPDSEKRTGILVMCTDIEHPFPNVSQCQILEIGKSGLDMVLLLKGLFGNLHNAITGTPIEDGIQTCFKFHIKEGTVYIGFSGPESKDCVTIVHALAELLGISRQQSPCSEVQHLISLLRERKVVSPLSK